MDWLLDPFVEGDLQQALYAGVLAATSLAVLGTWIVIRGMTFLGDALAHTIIPGIALALLFGFNPLIGAAIAALVTVGGINLIHRQTAFSEDVGIGLLFVGMLAIGVILATTANADPGTLQAILFGDVDAVSAGDVALLAFAAVLSIATTVLFYRHFLVLSFNEQKASLFGLRPHATHAVLLALLTLAIIGSFQTVGTLLVFGLLVGPPATAALVVRQVPTMMATATGIGIVSVTAGLIISYHAGTSGPATMAVIPIVLFFVVLAARSVFSKTVTDTGLT
ncbi:MAG: metal ABC transporter permease [Acidimicrobiia bacterium]